jgi:hypothetical protein
MMPSCGPTATCSYAHICVPVIAKHRAHKAEAGSSPLLLAASTKEDTTKEDKEAIRHKDVCRSEGSQKRGVLLRSLVGGWRGFDVLHENVLPAVLRDREALRTRSRGNKHRRQGRARPPRALFTSRVFEGMGGDYFVSQNFPNRLFTSSGFEEIIPRYPYKSPPL